ncbi:MAG: chloride channel protein, partial [Victivallales bacterium]|nr:chloride channel protein [Victivallales bacterium]
MKIIDCLHRFNGKTPWHRADALRVVMLSLCVVVGIVSGAAAVAMHEVAQSCRLLCAWLARHCGTAAEWVAPAFPAIGIFLCILFLEIFFRHRRYEISLWPAIREARNPGKKMHHYHTFCHILTSGVAVGMGISAGMEAPSALTGSAIGDWLGRKLKLSAESCTLLLCAGASAGIAAIFNAPLAGALFACEVLLPSSSAVLLIPLLIAAASGAVVSQFCHLPVNFPQIDYTWRMGNLWIYALIGLTSGVFAAAVIRLAAQIAILGRKMPGGRWLKGLCGALLLYLAFLLLPALAGQGFNFISSLLANHISDLPDGMLPFETAGNPALLILMLLVLALLKPLVSMLSTAAGGDGGMFAPSLVTGCFMGGFFYLMLQQFNITTIPALNCMAAGMAGMLAGVMHAPLTGMFLIAEMLSGYGLFVPLMVVVALATFFSKLLSGNNLYFNVVSALRAESQQPLLPPTLDDQEMAKVGDLADRHYYTLNQLDSFRTILHTLMASRQNVFPVLDNDLRLVGMVSERHLRPFILDTRLYDQLIVDDFMGPIPPTLPDDATVGDAARIFDQSNAEVIAVTHNG